MAGQEKKFVEAETADCRKVRGIVVGHEEAGRIKIREFGAGVKLVEAKRCIKIYERDVGISDEERVFAEKVREEMRKLFLREGRFFRIVSGFGE